MKLAFRLLIIDDENQSAQAAIRTLRTHLERRGFSLETQLAEDISVDGVRRFARNEGRNFDLVLIDFNLGGQVDGSQLAYAIRTQLPYTDVIFFSSDPGARLLAKLAENNVAGVFVSSRSDLGTALIGVADTIIGKAVDLNHMRGIAMAEVAEMDTLMEDILLNYYEREPEVFDGMLDEIINSISDSSERIRDRLEPLLQRKAILEIISDSSLFSSFQKYRAVRSLAKKLPEPPASELVTLAPYQDEIINNRNLLAHAKEEITNEGKSKLRSVRRGGGALEIDDAWMAEFRTQLNKHRGALTIVCDVLKRHISEEPISKEELEKSA